MATAHWITGDARTVMADLPPASIDLILTSPPFWNLRSYLEADHADKAAEMGSEATPGEFIDALLDITEAAARLLTPHGSLCVELGDSMFGSGGAGGDYAADGLRDGQPKFRQQRNPTGPVPLTKSHCLIPEIYRFALAYGFNPLTGRTTDRWRVRNTITWCRNNPPVGALGDKFRPATSDLVIACKAKNRWFDLDAVREPHKPHGGNHIKNSKGGMNGYSGFGRDVTERVEHPAGAPPLDWWLINPTGYTGSHYAVFPPELCVKPVEAMCPRRVCRSCNEPSRRIVDNQRSKDGVPFTGGKIKDSNGTHDGDVGGHWRYTTEYTTTGWSTCGCPGTDGLRLDGWHTGTNWRAGVVCDPFAGTGTVGAVSTGHGRDAILIDLDPRNLALARERVGMFLEETTAAEVAAHVG